MQTTATQSITKRGNRDLWLVTITSITLLASMYQFITIRTGRIIVENEKGILQKEIRLQADNVSDKLGAFETEMIALAEQRGMREGVARWISGKAADDWKDGFLKATQAMCLSIIARGEGVISFTLREQQGQRIAGSGLEMLQVNYIETMKRIQKEPMAVGSSKNYSERWMIPVRDEQARPLAYLLAELDFGQMLAELWRQSRKLDSRDLWYLVDTTGNILWISERDLELPKTDRNASQLNLKGKIYDLAQENIYDTEFTLCLARPEQAHNTWLNLISSGSIFAFVGATFLLIITALLISKRQRIIQKF